MNVAKNTRATVIPSMVYRDAPAAIDWLCRAFGFEKKMVVPGADGSVVHAELSFGNGMIMLGSSCDNDFGKIVRTPESLGGLETASPYLIVDDVDGHYERAIAAGATIVKQIKTESYGGRGYACRDLEGHFWNVGNYDPWAEQ